MNSPILTLQDLSIATKHITTIDTFCPAVQSLQEATPVSDLISLSTTLRLIPHLMNEGDEI